MALLASGSSMIHSQSVLVGYVSGQLGELNDPFDAVRFPLPHWLTVVVVAESFELLELYVA